MPIIGLYTCVSLFNTATLTCLVLWSVSHITTLLLLNV